MHNAVISIIVVVIANLALASAVRAQQLAPTNLQASASGDNVLITWRVREHDAPDAFRLEAGSGPGLADLAIVNIPWNAQRGVDAHFAAAGVAPGLYYVRVRSVRERVASFPSEEVVMHVGVSQCALPSAPHNITASVSGHAVTLNWDAAAAGGAAAGYVIEAGSNPGAPDVAVITIDSTSVSMVAAPGRYFVRLRAMGLCGASEPSREVEIMVP